jgi:hypothetical protein
MVLGFGGLSPRRVLTPQHFSLKPNIVLILAVPGKVVDRDDNQKRDD